MGASPEQLAKAALQESYKQTLQRFGLVEQKGNRFSVTTFGRMLVQYIQAEE
jgi:ribosomal protein S19E (S16A)